ncbi:MAG: hypothetical protein N4A72_20735 [Bacteroidales bacterium]|jgi:tetratricopeptide (TPR) repeat protein|nr:hypothetical protein [Bacteroidales bacterium]
MKKILLGLIVVMPLLVCGQNNVNSIELTDIEKKNLLGLVTDLFNYDVEMSFNITVKDIQSSFSKIPDSKRFDRFYLSELMSKSKEDTLNPILLCNIGTYYSKKNNIPLANEYYSRSLRNLDVKYCDNDSSFFYSYRGILKSNLGDSSAFDDFDRAISINPNDSISLHFYPMLLLSRGDLLKSKEVIKKLFTKNQIRASIAYVYLSVIEALVGMSDIVKQRLDNPEYDYKSEYINKDYNEIIDYTLLDSYLREYKGNLEIENCRIMAELFGLFCKIPLFDTDSDNRIIINYTNTEKKRIDSLISELLKMQKKGVMNEYTLNKCLGISYFMIEEWDKSMTYYKKAIDVFPDKKESDDFNRDECYKAILAVNYQRKDTVEIRKILYSKIYSEIDLEDTADEFSLLAIHYFRNGNLRKAEEYCKKVRDIDPNNFNALRLLSHLNFVKGSDMLTEYYGESAGRYVRNDNDAYNLLLQFAVYFIYNGDFKSAAEKLKMAKNINNKGLIYDKLQKIIGDA